MTTTSDSKPNTNKLAYSYIRFSSPKQGAEGKDSLRRQLDRTREFCHHKGLTLVEEMKDLGISGFKGANLEEDAKLGEFLKRVKEGKIPVGSTLVVESFDRISRTKILRCQTVLQQLLISGIAVAPLSFNGQILTEETVNENPSLLILAIVEQMRGSNESEEKSKRINAKLDDKRQAVAQGVKVYFGGFMPGWIEGIKDGEWILNQERVAIVKFAFAEYLAVGSLTKVARKLNANFSIGLKYNRKTRYAQQTVKDLLTNDAVIGTFTLKGIAKPIKNYLPKLVTEDDFRRVQMKMSTMSNRHGGSPTGRVANLFRGLCKCDECGGHVNVLGRVIKNKAYNYYYCTNSVNNACKSTSHIKTTIVERAFFDILTSKKPSDFMTGQEKEDVLAMESLQAKEAALDRVINETMDALKAGFRFEQVKSTLEEVQKEKQEVESKIKDLHSKVKTVSEMPKAVGDFVSLLKSELSDNGTRQQMANIMPSIVKRVGFTLGSNRQFRIDLLNGGFLVLNTTNLKTMVANQTTPWNETKP